MTLDEKIYQYMQKLPHSFQEELLDYAEYLLMKAEQQEKQDWTSLSLTSAMRDMEDLACRVVTFCGRSTRA